MPSSHQSSGGLNKEFNWDKRGLVMRFNAKMLSNRNEDKGRRFVFQVSERALRKTRILAMNPATWLQT
tara:strand:+ start:58 stop:261 length:204 start_codon:yes stop_codon:yes gene_type:complete